MGRRRKGRKKAAAAASVAAPAAARLPSQEGANGVYVAKKVLASFFSYYKPTSLIEIDPHYSTSGNMDNRHDANCFRVDPKPELNSPPSHLSKLISYGTVVFDSKAYFIGGKYYSFALNFYDRDFVCDDDYDIFMSDDDDDDNDVFSGKMFVHHLIANKWDESPSELNIPRSHFTVVVVGEAEKVIYVFGGFTDNGFTHDGRKNSEITNKEHWIECFNLVDYNKDAKWEFLGPDSAPPDALFKDYYPLYHFVYERGSQIVFCMQDSGFYSFNCISKTWAPFHCNVSKEARVKCFKVVVIDHLLFWHYYGVIYAYDLMKDRLVMEQRLEQLNMTFATPCYYGEWPEPTFLERVGNDTLILVVRDSDADDVENDLHFYKFQIQRLTTEPRADHNLRLLQIGFGVFPSPGDIIHNVLAV